MEGNSAQLILKGIAREVKLRKEEMLKFYAGLGEPIANRAKCVEPPTEYEWGLRGPSEKGIAGYRASAGS